MPGRVRSLAAVVPAALVVAVTAPTLLDVFPAAGTPGLPSALRDAAVAVGLGAAAAAVAGVVLVLLEPRVRVPPAKVRAVGVAALAAVAVAALVGGAILVRAHPVRLAQNAWTDFTDVYDTGAAAGSSHLGSGVGSNRYDFWRVALDEFADAPLAGIGADNFAIPYLRERRSDEEPLYPHSLQVQVLSQTGLVGAALFLGFLVAAFAAAARARHGPPHLGARRRRDRGRGYWLVHASGDWLWEIPGLGAPAFAALGLGAGLARGEPRGTPRAGRRPSPPSWSPASRSRARSPSLARGEARPTTRRRAWRDDPDAAYARLATRAAAEPAQRASGSRRGRDREPARRVDRMRSAFERALRRNPGSWYAELELGVVEAVTGRRERALGHSRARADAQPARAGFRSSTGASKRAAPSIRRPSTGSSCGASRSITR